MVAMYTPWARLALRETLLRLLYHIVEIQRGIASLHHLCSRLNDQIEDKVKLLGRVCFCEGNQLAQQ